PVAFTSRKLQPQETRYPIHDKEMLAVVYAMMTWRVYLHGSKIPVKIFTDHQSLRYFTTQPNLNNRQKRWSDHLAEFKYEIHYRQGSLNVVPDALSRRPGYCLNAVSTSSPNAGSDIRSRIRDALPTDKHFGEIYKRLSDKSDLKSDYFLRNGLLYVRDGYRI